MCSNHSFAAFRALGVDAKRGQFPDMPAVDTGLAFPFPCMINSVNDDSDNPNSAQNTEGNQGREAGAVNSTLKPNPCVYDQRQGNQDGIVRLPINFPW